MGVVHVNPLRTVEHEAAIFRIPKSASRTPARASARFGIENHSALFCQR